MAQDDYGYPSVDETLPPEPRQQQQQPYQSAIGAILSQMNSDTINAPKRPEPVMNPYNDPLVMLSMAFQGKAADAIVQGSQIERFNKSRVDAYQDRLRQSEDYRRLRHQRMATTLAELQAKQARALVDDERWAIQEKRITAGQKADDDARTRGLELAEARLEWEKEQEQLRQARANSFNEWVKEDENRDDYNRFVNVVHDLQYEDTLTFFDKKTGQWAQVDLKDKSIPMKERMDGFDAVEAMVRRYADVLSDAGFHDRGEAYIEKFLEAKKVQLGVAKDVFGDDPDKIGGLDEAKQIRAAAGADATRLTRDPDSQTVSGLLEWLEPGEQQEFLGDLAGRSPITAGRVQDLGEAALTRRISSRLDENPKYLNTPEGMADAKGAVEAAVGSAAENVGGAANWTEAKARAKAALVAAGIPAERHRQLLEHARRFWSKTYRTTSATALRQQGR